MRAAGRTSGLNGWRGRSLARAIAAVSATAATLLVFAFDEHAPYDIQAGPVARVVAGLVPLLAAAVAGYAVLRPWRGFLAVLILTPVFDVAQVSLNVGPVQVISQTLFVGVLALGVALRGPRSGEASVAAPVPPSPPSPLAETSAAPRSWGAPISPDRVAGVAVVALLALATLSTAVSPDRTTSATILLHGILEPAAMAFLLLALRPRRRDLAVVAVVLAISVGLGGLLNMLQSIPAMKSLAVMQDDRLYFSRITYFNVGLFGEMLAMAMPILLAALAAHRYLHLRRAVLVLLVAAIVVSLASLFLTFSKSAYLATFGGSLLLVLLIVHSWRRRASIVLAACLLSTVLIPWPAFFLQVLPPIEQAYRNAMVSLMGESRYDSWNPSTLSGQGSLLERWYATRAGIEMAIDHPLLGIGLDQFQTQYVAGRYKPPQAQLNLDWAHSMYPEAAAELGLPALAAELIVYAAALLALWRVYRAPPDPLTRLLAGALLAAMVSWQIVGTAFAGDMYRPWRNMASDYVMMAVLVASAFALYRLTRREPVGGAAALEAQVGQDRVHPSSGLAAMRDAVLGLGRPLAESAAAGRLQGRLEDRVVAETAGTAGSGRDAPFQRSVGEPDGDAAARPPSFG
jgi:O-antigen ligase